MYNTYNGMPATAISAVRWQKSRRSNSTGNCVELASLPDGGVAVRNSRHPDGPALIYTRSELESFVRSAKEGEFDDLIA